MTHAFTDDQRARLGDAVGRAILALLVALEAERAAVYVAERIAWLAGAVYCYTTFVALGQGVDTIRHALATHVRGANPLSVTTGTDEQRAAYARLVAAVEEARDIAQDSERTEHQRILWSSDSQTPNRRLRIARPHGEEDLWLISDEDTTSRSPSAQPVSRPHDKLWFTGSEARWLHDKLGELLAPRVPDTDPAPSPLASEVEDAARG
jgi:hypothetical protein